MQLKPVYALVRDLQLATRIVKLAKAAGLEARTFDTAERLLEASRQREPALVFLDCEALEKEAFRLLEDFRKDELLSKVPRIGYLLQGVGDLKREMRDAGCEQVYAKSQFMKELEMLLVRYAHGIPSGI